MKDCREAMSVSQFQNIIEILNPSMDDYLYIYDMKNDYYCISPSAVERFKIPSNEFYNVEETHKQFVYYADLDELLESFNQMYEDEELKFHNMEYRWLKHDGTPIWINCRGRILRDEEGDPEFLVGCVNEIGKKQKADNVTGLFGESRLREEIEAANKEGRMEGFIMRIGIDDFKDINENHGIEYGDMILRKTAECIEIAIGSEQSLYRIVADEFLVLDMSGRTLEEAKQLFRKIRWRIEKFIGKNHYDVFYTVSAGILRLTNVENQSYANLMKLSEFALTEAKVRGKNQYYIYALSDYQSFLKKKELIAELRHAVNNNFEGFEAYFQPIVDIREDNLICAEALLRFQTEEKRYSPVEFIPLLEESGLIIPVGRWMLDYCLGACKKIRETKPNFRVSVNISNIQVLKSDILGDILASVEKYELPPGSVMIEMTESGFLETDNNFIRFCDGLKKNGILFALDDFGTGYSNFHYLCNLNPDTIKIDRTFTVKALKFDYEYKLLQHMVDMTHCIQIKICIEGIETEAELKKICEMNPDYIQGYYFGKPCPYSEFVEKYTSPKK